MAPTLPLLMRPPQPGLFRICPHCLAWFSLRWIEERFDGMQGDLTLYRCTKCDGEIEFAQAHPSGVI